MIDATNRQPPQLYHVGDRVRFTAGRQSWPGKIVLAGWHAQDQTWYYSVELAHGPTMRTTAEALTAEPPAPTTPQGS